MYAKFIYINPEADMVSHPIAAGFSGAVDIRRLERDSRRHIAAGYLLGALLCLAGALVKSGPAMMFVPPLERPERPIIADLITLPPESGEITETPEHPAGASGSAIPTIPGGRLPVFKAPVNDLAQRLSSRPDLTGREYRAYLDRQIRILSNQFASSLPRSFTLPRDNPDRRIPLPRFLVRDTGRYRAEVVIPPGDRKGVQGYIRIPYAWGGQLDPPDTLCLGNVRGLTRALNRFTNIEASVSPRQVILDKTGGLTTYPVIYMTVTAPFELSEEELTTLSLQVGKGGLLIIDNGAPGGGPDFIARSVHEMARKFIGWTWSSRTLPHDHTLYHCFFDFPDGPPPGASGEDGDSARRELVGYFNRDTQVAVYCPQNYGRAWADVTNTAALRMGVNLVVYALTRYKEWYFPETGETRLVSEEPVRAW
jgi:hypothetical protein